MVRRRAAGAIVLVILGANGWAETPNGRVAGGWNWSDLLVHVSIGASIAAGNFPPQVPYFVGEPLTYHWFADFDGAIASSVAGVDLIGTYFVTSALFAAVLGLVVWALGLRLTGRRAVATIAAILVCFGGGLGWIRLVGDLIAGSGSALSLVSTTSYDNTWADGWPFFRIASVFGTGFLPHRATTLGLPGLVAAVLLVVTCLDRRPAGVLLGGVLAALLAPFQFFAFPATYLIVGLYVVTSGAWRAKTVLRDAVLFLAPVVLAGPFILDAVARQGDVGAFKLVAGWASAPLSDGPAAVGVLLPDESRDPVRPGTHRGLDGPTPTGSRVPRDVAPRAVHRAERDPGERRRLRHEQVLPDHVDRRGDPRRVGHPPLATTAHRACPRRVCPLAGAHRGLARPVGHGRAEPGTGGGRAVDRREHPGPIRVRDRRLHQQPGRPRRKAADIDVRAVRVQSRVRPRPTRRGHQGDLLRWPGRRGRSHGDIRSDVCALERRRARLPRPADRLHVQRRLPDGLRPRRRHRSGGSAGRNEAVARAARAISPWARRRS